MYAELRDHQDDRPDELTSAIVNFLSVSKIYATGVSIGSCTFETWQGSVFTADPDGSVDVGPPSPVKSVSCTSGGQQQCLTLYRKSDLSLAHELSLLIHGVTEDCTATSTTGGFEYIGFCCTGFYCAAGKCRAMNASG